MTQQQADLEHLRLLSIFHYVVAGLGALFSLFPMIHVILGLAMWTGQMGSGEEERMMGALFTLMGLMFVVGGMAVAACIAIAGRSIAQRRRHLFCLVVAGVQCLFAPFGTALGVFTFVVLLRPSVKELFGVAAPAPGAPAA